LSDQARHLWVATHILPHESEVRGWLRRHVASLGAADIDDLIQEAYSRLWKAQFVHITNGRSYMFMVVRNLVIEQARRARIVPMERMGEIEELRITSEEPGPERRVSGRQELERLERIVASLPAQCRRAFELHKFQGLTQREAAQELNVTEKTIEKYMATALMKILDALKEDDESAARRLKAGISDNGSQRSGD